MLERVAEAAGRAGRSPTEVTVVVVVKGRSVSDVSDLYDRGHRDFGHNRAQELVVMAAELPSDIRWHFVGPLQTNKVRGVRSVAHLLHSLDRQTLATAWLKGPGIPPPALLEVNIDREPQKSGVDPDLAASECERFLGLGLAVRGLMTIPRVGSDARAGFQRLRRLRDRLAAILPSVTALSMGMSDDYEAAVEEGATLIRPGRAIFTSNS